MIPKYQHFTVLCIWFGNTESNYSLKEMLCWRKHMAAKTRYLCIISYYPKPHMEHIRHVKLKHVYGGLWQCSLSRWVIDWLCNHSGRHLRRTVQLSEWVASVDNITAQLKVGVPGGKYEQTGRGGHWGIPVLGLCITQQHKHCKSLLSHTSKVAYQGQEQMSG